MNLFGDGDYLGVNFSKNEQKNGSLSTVVGDL